MFKHQEFSHWWLTVEKTSSKETPEENALGNNSLAKQPQGTSWLPQ